MADETLIEWAEEQAGWVRDALRRHALSAGFELSEADKDAIFRNVAYSAGLDVEPPLDAEPLTDNHLARIVFDGPRTVLCSLGPIQRLNRLATDQKLTFGIDGITLIYGDNGSGKSGYCRVAKKICRSSTAEDLLGNVLEAERPAEPAEVVVRYRLDGEADVVEDTWVDGTKPPPSISQISVFDAKNARFFIDKKNRIGFLPADIALLQCHGTHRKEMGLALDAEIKTIAHRAAIPLPGGYSEGGDVAILFSRLDPTSTVPLPAVGEIEELAAWAANDDEELQALEATLSDDPAMLAEKYARAKGVLETYAQHVAVAEGGLSQAAADQLKAAYDEVQTTAEVAALAAASNFEADPLPFTGQQVWQRMYEHAKNFAVSIDPELTVLPQTEGDLCMLCQQPLSEAAADRIQRFNRFVEAEASKAAKRAIAAHDSAMKTLGKLAIPTKDQTALSLGEYATLSQGRNALAEAVAGFIDVAHSRRAALQSAAANGQFLEICSLPPDLHDRLISDLGDLEQERVAYQKAATDEQHWAPHRLRLSALRDRRKLSQDLATVLARRADVERVRKLQSALAAVEIKSVSLQITSLRRGLVMKGLEKRIHDEISRLKLNHIPFAVKDQSRDGQSFFDVGLKAARPIQNDKVLSEGEQRALALACFLGELALDDAKHGLIIDDPVSSLDHIRIRRVAERLVAEAGEGRQIIVFTHNLLFFNEMVEAAARANPQVPLAKRFIRKSETEGFGLISDTEEPWIAQAVTKRIENLRKRLRALEGAAAFDTDEWRRTVKDFYTDLRETWERLVEEILLSKVVERLNSDVRTQSLKGVIIEDDDYRTVYWAMKAVSERSGHDMAIGRAVPTPTPADMKADLDRVSEYCEAIQKRRKETAKRRLRFEQPPVAEAV